jgi:hypothetical protein
LLFRPPRRFHSVDISFRVFGTNLLSRYNGRYGYGQWRTARLQGGPQAGRSSTALIIDRLEYVCLDFYGRFRITYAMSSIAKLMTSHFLPPAMELVCHLLAQSHSFTEGNSRYTVDACFISTQWHIHSKGMAPRLSGANPPPLITCHIAVAFAFTVLCVFLATALVEGVRRASREYDRRLVASASFPLSTSTQSIAKDIGAPNARCGPPNLFNFIYVDANIDLLDQHLARLWRSNVSVVHSSASSLVQRIS